MLILVLVLCTYIQKGGLANKGCVFLRVTSNVLAYTMNPTPPQPYRFKSSSGRLQIPSASSWLPDVQFFRVMRETQTYRTIGNVLFYLRTIARRTLFGDRVRNI